MPLLQQAIVFFVLVTLNAAVPVTHPVPLPIYADSYEDRDYRFNYLVKDGYSYNYHTRNENKQGGIVTGQYTVLEPTGQLRVVNYVADEYGFRAEVYHQPAFPGAVHPPER